MKTQPYVGQYECLMFATIAHGVARGLGCVLIEGVLPQNYRGVFRSAVILCREIVEGAYYASNPDNPCRDQVSEKSGATIWFSHLTKGHPEIYENFVTYDDVVTIGDTLEDLVKDESPTHLYPDPEQWEKWIYTIQNFFISIWLAAEAECVKEGIPMTPSTMCFPSASETQH